MNLLNSDFTLVLILFMKSMSHITKNRSKERFFDKNENKNILLHIVVV